MKLLKVNIGVIFLFLLAVNTALAQIRNAGVSGNTTLDLLQRLDTDVLEHRPDFVILLVGTNDMLNSKKMISYASYKNNLWEIVKRIKEVGASVLLMSPPPVDSVYLFQRHDRRLFKEAPNVKLDTARKIVEGVAHDNGVGYLDLYQAFGKMNLPEHNKDLFFRNEGNSGAKDGVHPTALGYRFIAESVFHFLKENQFIGENKKIVCFGDSITYGSGVKNGGTVIGENYPAVLAQLIEENYK
ncbi:GDSL-type esterase/lipase family protein [Zobellia galactanivorans]|uniref:SGNH/GDSL hydrolase family protein n=1 Tax=Zobellia TaxID=112040 RepID=UPI00137474BB|nr:MULTISPECIES: GDSL-type esterase/lipase family protein [Zobellia]MBU3024117.1 hypothetical protein [Zobellia galactanivorans]MDO6809762.1 GDSL-type esterase/lipase family protein [Zobellia galactanivorans]